MAERAKLAEADQACARAELILGVATTVDAEWGDETLEIGLAAIDAEPAEAAVERGVIWDGADNAVPARDDFAAGLLASHH